MTPLPFDFVENVDFTFSARLARENGWTENFSNKVIEEYRKFLFLATISQQPVTPSDEIDQAWHLHMTFTQHYWDYVCAEILQISLHHDPLSNHFR